jgi:transcriptional regulator GlxA family with amidase domain
MFLDEEPESRSHRWPVWGAKGTRPYVVGFFLPAPFILMSYAAIVEPLRAANTLTGTTLYEWRFITADGGPVEALGGGTFQADAGIDNEPPMDLLVICCPAQWIEYRDPRVFAWLRRVVRKGVVLGGVSGGVWAIARSGLLKGRVSAVHWNHAAAFKEEFPDHRLTRSLFAIDGNFVTSAGGVSAIDMIHAMILEHHGRELATEVSEWFLHNHIRLDHDPQRMSLQYRTGVNNRVVLKAMDWMERNLEEPIPVSEIASYAGVSVRQLQRLFKDHVGVSAAGFHRELRLDRAKTLLQQTTATITEVAMCTGFTALAQFSTSFRAKFGYPPSQERRTKH